MSKSEVIAAITAITSLSLYCTVKFFYTCAIGDHPHRSRNSSLRNLTSGFYSLPQNVTNTTASRHSSQSSTTNNSSSTSDDTLCPSNVTLHPTLKSLPPNTTALRPSHSSQKLPAHDPDNNLNFIILNPKFCTRLKPQVLVWVYSAPPNFERRQTIRKTWGNASLYSLANVRVVFSLAVTSQSRVQQKIKREMSQYGDLIQDGGFIDSYRNLSLKAQGMLRWTAMYCTSIKLLFKVDDDSFVIPHRLSLWLQQFVNAQVWPYNSILGSVWLNPGPKRYIAFRWKVTTDEWAKSFFAPKACPGLGYFITSDAIQKLRDAIIKVPFLWLEDMYITGVLAEAARLSHKDISPYTHFMYNSNTVDKIIDSQSIFLVGHVPGFNEVHKLWKTLAKINTTQLV